MSTGRSSRADLLLLTLLAVAVRIAAYRAHAHLSFDDGVYGASALAMRGGHAPFVTVFSSQGPLFLPLVFVADLVGFHTLDAPRILAVASGVVITLAVYFAALTLTDRRGALLASALATVSGSLLYVTGPLASDGPALAFATIAIALLLRWRDDLTIRRGVVLGLAVGAAISVKALLAGVIVPVAAVLLVQRKYRVALASGLTAITFHFLLWVPFGFGRVWDQAYAYHLDVKSDLTPGANLAKIGSTLVDRDLPLLACFVIALVAAALTRRRDWDLRDLILGGWLAGIFLVLATEHPLWRPHVSQFIPVAALIVLRFDPPRWLLYAAVILLVPYHALHVPTWHHLDYAGFDAQIEAALEKLPSGAKAIGDDPGLTWRTGHKTTPNMVDTSSLRLEAGNLHESDILRDARDPFVCAVFATSGSQWLTFPDLPERLGPLGYRIVARDDRGRFVATRDDDCGMTR